MSAMTASEDRDQRKLEAAERALALVRPGMKLGLGSGTTALQSGTETVTSPEGRTVTLLRR